MRLVGRIIGWLLLLGAAFVLARELLVLSEGGGYRMQPLGQVWFSIDPPSLNLLQAVTERYVSIWAWDNLIFPILEAPALLVLGLPGLLLVVLCRRRSRRVFTS